MVHPAPQSGIFQEKSIYGGEEGNVCECQRICFQRYGMLEMLGELDECIDYKRGGQRCMKNIIYSRALISHGSPPYLCPSVHRPIQASSLAWKILEFLGFSSLLSSPWIFGLQPPGHRYSLKQENQ